MKKVLVTGMTSSQSSSRANLRTLQFSGVLVDILEKAGYDVTHEPPSVEWDAAFLDEYDAVVAGVSPITSVSANYAYGGLSVIDTLKDSDKLIMFIDAPAPHQIFSSLRAISTVPDNIVKQFYSSRREYFEAKRPGVKNRLLSAVDYLLNDNWKTCLYPELPWNNHYKVCAQVGDNAAKALKPVNVDSYLVSDMAATTAVEKAIVKKHVWVASDVTSSWTKRVAATSKFPFTAAKDGYKSTDASLKTKLEGSSGAAISPHGRDGSWWTPMFAYAMNTITPVVTDWRDSGTIGDAWNYIASAVEDLDPFDRIDLSFSQKEQYADKIPDRSTVLQTLETHLQLQ